MDERLLAERLITYDTSAREGLGAAAGFVKGWLESHRIRVTERLHDGLPVLLAEAGPAAGPLVVLHGHVDVVPARAGQFEPRVEGDRLIGRGAYDMKGALAAMMVAMRDAAAQDGVRVLFACVPDEESDDLDSRSIDALIAGPLAAADFALTGEPTDLHIGVQAKGVLAVKALVHGRAAHGSTPWLGDNAILKAHDAFRRIETLPFSRQSSDLFDRPSINLARIHGGDAFNKVPDLAAIDVDIRYLPTQDPGEILAQIRTIDDLEIVRCFERVPAIVLAAQPVRPRAAPRRRPGGAGRRAVRRARRRERRGLLPREGHPGRRVRARRRRAPRPRRVGLAALARALPPGPRGLLRGAPRRARARIAAARRRRRARMSTFEEATAPPRVGRTVFKRAALAALLIVLATAGAVSTAVILEVQDDIQRLILAHGCEPDRQPVPRRRPQAAARRRSSCSARTAAFADISAKRPARSDTIILLRLDPSRGVTSVMSVPRDLKVHHPDEGRPRHRQGQRRVRDRRPVAHRPHPARRARHPDQPRRQRELRRLSPGGRPARLRVRRRRPALLQRQQPARTGAGRTTRRSTSRPATRSSAAPTPWTTSATATSTTTSSASARQQDFLRQAKDQFGIGKLFGSRKALLSIFGEYTITDIADERAILRLVKLAYEASKNPIQEIHFRSDDRPELRDGDARGRSARPSGSSRPRGGRSGPRGKPRPRASDAQRSRGASAGASRARRASLGLFDNARIAEDQAIVVGARVGFPVYYPTLASLGSSYVADLPRRRARTRSPTAAATTTARTGSSWRPGATGQYYGIQGTSWKAPPILDNPSETVDMRGRKYQLFYDGNRLRLVAWRTPKAVYWVSNTLLQTLSNAQMRGIARSLQRVGG